MNREEKFVTVDKCNLHDADVAFADFMRKSEECFNHRACKNPKYYKTLSPSQLEEETCEVLRHVAPSTPFKEEDIILVSGHSFPDIMAGKYYGVEVKSTKDDKWTSVGSSIVESTRDQYVEDIYMMFGKLGGNVPEFRFRPYQDCLSNIAVTHSPRYMIDMEIREKREQTIFEKINMSYQAFHQSDDKIEVVRDYYISQGRKEGKQEMPWWVGRKTIETNSDSEIPSIRLLNNCSPDEVKELKAEMSILFPQVILGDYSEAALWLCTHRYLLSLNLRDLFSAGGQWKVLNGKLLDVPYPAVLGKLMEIMPYIKRVLSTNTELEYQEFNSLIYKNSNRLMGWLDQAEYYFDRCCYEVNRRQIRFADLKVDVRDYLLNPDKYQLRHKL